MEHMSEDNIYCLNCGNENLIYVDNYGGYFLYECPICKEQIQVEEFEEI